MEQVEEGLNWARAVIDGTEPACKWVRLACERHFNDLIRCEANPGLNMYFDAAEAESKLQKLGELRHVKGPMAGQFIEFLPWQKFGILCVFGWKRWTTDARDMAGIQLSDRENWPRRFRKWYQECGRKNGKSTQAAAVGLIGLGGDDEEGADVFSVATKKDQAKIVFDTARQMARKSPELPFKALQHSITVPGAFSSFTALSSDSDKLDGLNTYLGIIDELHAHKTREVLEVMESSTGARVGALLMIITTAGNDIEGICYEERSHAIQVLEGILEDDSIFAMIFTAEEHAENPDNPALFTDHDIWKLANPNLGVSVSISDFEAQARKAQNVVAARAQFLRKKLNIWVGGETAFLDMGAYDACKLPFQHDNTTPCFIGLDLSLKRDLTSWVECFILPDNTVEMVPHVYVPGAAMNLEPSRVVQMYRKWEKQGFLTILDTDTLDQDLIADEIKDFCADHYVKEIDYDAWNAAPIVASMEAEGMPMVAIAQTVKLLAPAMEYLEAGITDKTIRHDGHPVLRWNMRNVVAHEDKNGNRFPNKSAAWSKIDVARAGMNALARICVTANQPQTAGAWVA